MLFRSNDYQPRGLTRTYELTPKTTYDPNPRTGSDVAWRQPWSPIGTGWDLSRRRTFSFDNATGGARLDFDRTASPDTNPLTDWLGYDVSWAINQKRIPSYDYFNYKDYATLNELSDVKLALTYRRESGDGPLRLTLTKQGHAFTAEFTPGKVSLQVTRPGESTPVTLAEAAVSAGQHRIEFANADYRVTVRVDGAETLATTPEQFHPNIAALLKDFDDRHPQAAASVSVEANRQRCVVEHLSLWRDVYYLNGDWGGTHWAMPDNFPRGIPADPTDAFGYRSPRMLMRLGPDEFFTMGDNSMMSSDARCWRIPVKLPYERLDVAGGRVPRRFLLGRAFFVYWPAGFAPVKSLPGFVPNFGEMRFIH